MSPANDHPETWYPFPICPACGRKLYLVEVAGTIQCANCGWVCETCCEGGVPLEGEACPVPQTKTPEKKQNEKSSKPNKKNNKNQK